MAKTDGWWETRLGLRSWTRSMLHEEIPGGSKFSYALGSATLVTFLILCVTGIFQVMYYVPSTAQAYNSVNFMRFQVPFGWLVFGTHFWAASVMVVLVLVHLAQVFIWGAYKKPRELVWLLGVLLAVFTLAAVFTGGPLVWDEAGYWAARVGLGIAGSLPLLGGLAKTVLFGGETVGQLTLSRFFFLHVAIVPIIIATILLMHLVTFRRAGAAGTWSPSDKTGDFWPKQVIMDLLLSAGVLTFIVGLAAFFLTPVTGPADPIDATYVARPDWPFLWLFQLIKYLPGSIEWVGAAVVPLILVAVLAAVPWFDRKETRAPGKRLIAIGAFTVIILLLAGLTWAGANAAPPANQPAGAPGPTPASAISTATPPPGPSPASVTIGGIEHGTGIFISYCQGCHGPEGKGGVPNPGSKDGSVPALNPIDPAIKSKDPQKFVDNMEPWLQLGVVPDPAKPGEEPKLKMPSFGLTYALTQQQIADVEAYVTQINGVPRAAITKPGIPPRTFWWATFVGFVIIAVVGGAAIFMIKE